MSHALLKRLAGLALGTTMAVAAFAAAATAEEKKLTLVLTNDIYKVDNAKARGGFPRLAAVVKAEKARDPNTLYFHAGDLISPSLMSGFDKGEHTIELTNIVPPDFFTPGNHEYDFGPEIFAKRMGALKATKLAANLRTADGKKVEGFEDWKVVEVNGVKLGIFGMTADDSAEKSLPGKNLVFAPTLKTSIDAAKALRAEGVDLVVGLVHANRTVDMQMFNSGAFDIILTGDDHDLAVFFNGKTAMAESKEEAEFVTAIDLTVDVQVKDGKRSATWWPNFRIIDTATVQPEPVTEAKAEEYRKMLSKELDVEIGKTEGALDSRKSVVRTQEAAIGNLVADAARWATKADFAMANGGGIRGNKQYAPGSAVTRRDVLVELPFGNRDVLVEVTGEQMLAALENGVSMVETEQGRFPQISGISFEYDKSKPAGSRVVSVKVGDQPLDPKKTYKLATNDYVLQGGDGFKSIVGSKVLLGERDAKLNANNVMAYVVEALGGKITSKVEGRIVAK